VRDVIVVGGGLTGAAVARDCALRGLSVLLLERDDWGGGEPGWLLRGAPRSAELDRASERLLADEVDSLTRIAAHLVRPCTVLVPVLRGERPEHMEAALDARGRTPARLDGAEARRVEPELSPWVDGALSVADSTVDLHRLCWATVLDAMRAGAEAFNHARVEALLREGGRVSGVRYRAVDGRRVEEPALAVVNAAGPWAPELVAMAGATLWLRPVRRMDVVYAQRLTGAVLSAEAVDGREVVLAPHGPATYMGGVTADHHGDLEAAEPQPEEVDHLVQAAERVFPAIRERRPARAAIRVQAALAPWGSPAGELTGRFEVVDHERTDSVPGLFTVVGGTPTLHRAVAERATDAVCGRLAMHKRCVTAAQPLPGATGDAPSARELAAMHGLTALAATRLVERHGTEAREVLVDARGGRLVCRCEALTEAELVHAARSEQVRTLADAFRRAGMAAGPCAGTACVERASEVVGEALGWSPSQCRDACREHQVAAWRGRAPVLDRWGWAQEELAYGIRRGWPGGL
jgi:glycerol-3-phosphate dehydrogenase